MDRWEPPVAAKPRARARTRRTRTQLNYEPWSDAIEITIGRVVIAFVFIVAGTFTAPTFLLSLAGPALIVALLAIGHVTGRWGSRSSRGIWVSDAISLGLLTPLVIVNDFSGVGKRAFLPGESAVYLQTAAAIVAVIVGLVLHAARTSEWTNNRIGSTLLPAGLSLIAIAGTYGDFRDSTVAGAIGLAWLLAAVGALVTQLVGTGIGLSLPGVLFLGFFVINLLIDPGFLSLGHRPAPVAPIHPLLMLVAGLAVFGDILIGATRQVRTDRRPSPAQRSGR